LTGTLVGLAILVGMGFRADRIAALLVMLYFDFWGRERDW